MPRGRPRKFALALSDVERTELTTWAQSRSLPHALVQRAKVILLSAEGLANTEVGRRVDLSHAMVGHWRRQFQTHRLLGLYDAPRSGRPRTHDDDAVARMLRTVLASPPPDATHWSTRAVAAKTKLSKSTVQRYFHLFGAQPHRTKGFQLSPDPFFIEKVRDVDGDHRIHPRETRPTYEGNFWVATLAKLQSDHIRVRAKRAPFNEHLVRVVGQN